MGLVGTVAPKFKTAAIILFISKVIALQDGIKDIKSLFFQKLVL